jgi:hypothetical protein
MSEASSFPSPRKFGSRPCQQNGRRVKTSLPAPMATAPFALATIINRISFQNLLMFLFKNLKFSNLVKLAGVVLACNELICGRAILSRP